MHYFSSEILAFFCDVSDQLQITNIARAGIINEQYAMTARSCITEGYKTKTHHIAKEGLPSLFTTQPLTMQLTDSDFENSTLHQSQRPWYNKS